MRLARQCAHELVTEVMTMHASDVATAMQAAQAPQGAPEARVGAGMEITHADRYDYRIVREDRGHPTGIKGSQPNPLRTAD